MADTADTIDAVVAALAAQGSTAQLQWADRRHGWGEGTILARRDGEAVVLTQLGRVEAEDRVERFGSEADAAASLRRRLVDPPVRTRTAEEREQDAERMRRRAEEIKAELRAPGRDA